MSTQDIATMHPDETLQERSPTSVSGTRVVIDGDLDKEVTELDPISGASSAAPAASGIPSAITQQGIHQQRTKVQNVTPMADRVQPVQDDSTP